MGVCFGEFEFDQESCRVLRAGVDVRLDRRTFELLCFFARRPGKLI